MSNRPNLWGFLDNNIEGIIFIVLIIVFGGCCEKCEGQAVNPYTKPHKSNAIDTAVGLWSGVWDSTAIYKPYDSAGSLINNTTISGTSQSLSIAGTGTLGYSYFSLYGVNMSKGTILKIDGRGNMYYKPSEFSKCDTATTMRFLYNIITNSYEKEEK